MSLVKSIQQFAAKGATFPLDPATYRAGMADLFQLGGQGPLHAFSYTNSNSSLIAYEKCPPLAAIINKKAQAYINGKTWVMDSQGKESTSQWANNLRKLLAKPNPLQSWKQFEAQMYITQQVFGYCVVLPILPLGRKDISSASSLWAIPGNMLTVKYTNKLWYQTDLPGIVESVTVCYAGTDTKLDLKSIHIFRDFSPSFNNMVFPETRIRPLELPINNIIGALESRNMLINYRGALGILSSENDKSGYIPIKDPDKKALQADFARYGLKNQQWKFIITSASVKWQQMGVPTRELMLFEEIEDDTNMLCDSYGYPIDLMAGSQRKTYQNSEAAGKGLYQNAIIPEADAMYDQWNEFFQCAANGCEMQKDYGHIPVLQADKAKEASARNTLTQTLDREFKNNWIHYNRVLEILQEDTILGMDKYYNELLTEGYRFGPVINARPAGPEELNPPSNNTTD